MVLTNDSYNRRIQHDVCAAKKLISLLPKKSRELYGYGLPVDILAEIATAYARGTLAVDGDGYDLEDGVEVKYASLKKYKSGSSTRQTAVIKNLNTKRDTNADLCIIIGDTISKVQDVVLRFFVIPSKVWKTKIKGNSVDFCFATDRHKWYMDYEVSQKEYGL